MTLKRTLDQCPDALKPSTATELPQLLPRATAPSRSSRRDTRSAINSSRRAHRIGGISRAYSRSTPRSRTSRRGRPESQLHATDVEEAAGEEAGRYQQRHRRRICGRQRRRNRDAARAPDGPTGCPLARSRNRTRAVDGQEQPEEDSGAKARAAANSIIRQSMLKSMVPRRTAAAPPSGSASLRDQQAADAAEQRQQARFAEQLTNCPRPAPIEPHRLSAARRAARGSRLLRCSRRRRSGRRGDAKPARAARASLGHRSARAPRPSAAAAGSAERADSALLQWHFDIVHNRALGPARLACSIDTPGFSRANNAVAAPVVEAQNGCEAAW